ncbi:MAG: amidase, partial [Proteobacteria bacterium]|nr:amidase [Pseudomonadota bacterium]
PFLEEVGADPGVLRIAVCGRPSNDVPVDADCLSAMAQAAALCADLGHHVEEAEPDYERAQIDEQRVKIIASCLRADIEMRAAELGIEPHERVEPMTWYLAGLADAVSGADYAAAVAALHRVGRQIGRFFLDYDVLLTPTLAKPPLAIGVLDPATDDAEAYAAAIHGFAAFPALSNATGAPAMSVPLYWNEAGLPIGVQFIARFGDEATLFRLAAQLEQARPWANRRPVVTAARP